jgi:hypothetical protein
MSKRGREEEESPTTVTCGHCGSDVDCDDGECTTRWDGTCECECERDCLNCRVNDGLFRIVRDENRKLQHRLDNLGRRLAAHELARVIPVDDLLELVLEYVEQLDLPRPIW